MKAEKDKKTGKWLIQYRYTDWQGKHRKSTKRGFATKREAEEWLRNFLITQKADFDMKFEDFWKMYCADMETRLREHTMRTKKYIVELKILPYFGNKRVNDITAADIRQWQNELIKMGYSPTYLKTINNQLSAIFNYAVRYYDLKSNPCAKAGSMGKSKAEEMDFWTVEEFRKFIDSVMNKKTFLYGIYDLVLDGDAFGRASGSESERCRSGKENNFYHKIISTSWKERCGLSPKDTEEQESDYHSRVSGYRYQRLYGQFI